MCFEIGVIVICLISLGIAVWTIMCGGRIRGLIHLCLTIIAPIQIFCLCMYKDDWMWGGDNYSFVIQTAFIDRNSNAYLILNMYVLLAIFFVVNVLFNILYKKFSKDIIILKVKNYLDIKKV